MEEEKEEVVKEVVEEEVEEVKEEEVEEVKEEEVIEELAVEGKGMRKRRKRWKRKW